jgi:RNA polymerase sigma-70 factor (sigma-E family)
MDAETKADFEAFVVARSASLFRTALALTGHRQQAEDLVQTALARTMKHWGRIRTDRPEAYVRAAMVRVQLGWWRSRSRRPETPTAVLPETLSNDPTGAVDTSLALAAALRRLPARDRAVLSLRYFEDLPTAEIAAAMGCSASTVRSQISRALRRLRELSPELDNDPAQEATR